MKKILIVLGVLGLLCGAVLGYLVLSHPHDHQGSRMALASLESETDKLDALSAKGLMPGDDEYDELSKSVAAKGESLATLSSVERDNDDQNALFTTLAIAAGAAGLALLVTGLVLRKKLAPSPQLAGALGMASR